MINNYFDILKSIEENIKLKTIIINRLVSFVLAAFIVLPFVLIDVNLLYLYYDLEKLLVIILIILFVLLIFLYTHFYLVSFKEYLINDYNKRKYIYFVNIIGSSLMGLLVFIIYLIAR